MYVYHCLRKGKDRFIRLCVEYEEVTTEEISYFNVLNTLGKYIPNNKNTYFIASTALAKKDSKSYRF